MSDIDEFLEHYGVRGQKWGVRKSRSGKEKYARSRKEINARTINKVVSAALLLTAIASDPRTKTGVKYVSKHMKTALIKTATVSGKAYRRMGEGEAERIIRRHAYVPRAGARVVPTYSRTVGEVLKIVGELPRYT